MESMQKGILVACMFFGGFLNAGDELGISDGLGPEPARRKGIRIRASLSTITELSELPTPVSLARVSQVSGDSTIERTSPVDPALEDQNIAMWEDGSIKGTQDSAQLYLKELEKRGPKELGYFLMSCFSRTTVCLMLPDLIMYAGRNGDNKTVRILPTEGEMDAFARAYFSTGFIASTNDVKGLKKLEKNYKPSETSLKGMLTHTKLTEPKDLRHFKDAIEAIEKAEKQKKKHSPTGKEPFEVKKAS